MRQTRACRIELGSGGGGWAVEGIQKTVTTLLVHVHLYEVQLDIWLSCVSTASSKREPFKKIPGICTQSAEQLQRAMEGYIRRLDVTFSAHRSSNHCLLSYFFPFFVFRVQALLSGINQTTAAAATRPRVGEKKKNIRHTYKRNNTLGEKTKMSNRVVACLVQAATETRT